MTHEETDSLEPARPMPSGYGNRLLLFSIRRMAGAGVNDAHAANALLGAFGRGYRRPLILTRAMMLELARVSGRRILVAPCCCARMTSDEARMMQATGEALRAPAAAHERLRQVLSSDNALGALTCVQAVAQAYADLGRPLDLFAPD